jgi:DNA-binding SARP family transcriptional activator
MAGGNRIGFRERLQTARRWGHSLRHSAEQNHRPLGRKSRAIIAYLMTHAGQRVRREALIALLWAERRDAHGRGSLRQCLMEIRRAAPDLMRCDHDEVWIERERAEEALKSSSRARLFEDLDNLTPEFDEWVSDERAKQAALEWLRLTSEVEDMLAHARSREVFPLIEQMRRIDPYNENWVRLAMRAEYSAGHPAGIVQAFCGFTECLKRDLGVGPTRQTQALRDHLVKELTSESSKRALPGVACSAPVERLLGMG